MAAAPILHRADELDAEWLHVALGVPVHSVQVERIPVAVASMVLRVEVEYDDTDTTLPRALIAKLAHDLPENRASVVAWHEYENEVAAYTTLVPQVPVVAPRCIWARVADDGSSYTLLMNALHGRVGSRIQPCTHEESVAALRAAAAIHATFWGRPLSDEFPWLPPFAASWSGLGERALAHVDALSDDLWEVPPHVVEWTRRLATSYTRITEELGAGRPHTVTHNDFKADNLVYLERDGGLQAGVVDWGHVTRYLGAFDVSGWIGLHHPAAVRREVEGDLFAVYLDALRTCGVTDYSRADLERDYRATMLLKLAVLPDIAAGGLTYHSSEALERQQQYIQRVTAAVADWSAGELLP